MTTLKIAVAKCNKCKAEIPDVSEMNVVTHFDAITSEETLDGFICGSCLDVVVEAEIKHEESMMYDCCNYGCIHCDPMRFDPQITGEDEY